MVLSLYRRMLEYVRPYVPRLLLAMVGAFLLLMVVAVGTGAGAFMASLVGPAWWLMPILMILVMAIVMALVMMPMMGHGTGGGMGHGMSHGGPVEGHHHESHEDAASIAARRYARGEISREEYLTVKRDLEGGGER